MDEKAIITCGYEFHLFMGKLYITPESDPDKQVVLSEDAVRDLLEYLIQRKQESYGAREINRPGSRRNRTIKERE